MTRVADWKRGLRRVLYPAYEARVVRRLPSEQLPKHVGVMLDGNRRWAKAVGADTAQGHRAGAANIEPMLGWCEEIGVEVVTLWLLSTDNLNRPSQELEPLLGIIIDAVETLAERGAEVVRRDRLVLAVSDPRIDRPAVTGLGELLDQSTEAASPARTPEQTAETALTGAPHAAARVTEHAAETAAPSSRRQKAHQDADEGVCAALLLTAVAADHAADDAIE